MENYIKLLSNSMACPKPMWLCSPSLREDSAKVGEVQRGARGVTASAWESTSTKQALGCIIISAFGLKRHLDNFLMELFLLGVG